MPAIDFSHLPNVWQALKEDDLLLEYGEPDSVVFNCLSGDTHQLNPIAMEALELLQAGPRDSESLAREICAKFELKDFNGMETQIRQLLSSFDELGLIYPAPK